jgi:hypothetical protein
MNGRLRLALVVIVAAAILLTGAAFELHRAGGGAAAGPLACKSCGGWSFGRTAHPGRPVSFSAMQLQNAAADPAVIDRVTLGHLSPGLRVVALDAAPDGSWAPRWNPATFPPRNIPRRTIVPLVGLRMLHTPRITRTSGNVRRRFQVLIGLEAQSLGRYSFDGVTIAYHVGSHRYRARYDYSMRVCVIPPTADLIRGAFCPALH